MFGLLHHCKYQQKWHFGAARSSPGRVCYRQSACMEEPCKEHPACLGSPGRGSAGELAVETRKEWCKVHIPLGSKRARVLKRGPGQFIVQLLLFLLVLQAPGKVWSQLNLSHCHHEEPGTRPMNT